MVANFILSLLSSLLFSSSLLPSPQTYHLPPTNILCEVSRGLAGVQHYGDVRLLLECMKKSSFASDSLNDDIIMAAIKVLAGQTREVQAQPKFCM